VDTYLEVIGSSLPKGRDVLRALQTRREKVQEKELSRMLLRQSGHDEMDSRELEPRRYGRLPFHAVEPSSSSIVHDSKPGQQTLNRFRRPTSLGNSQRSRPYQSASSLLTINERLKYSDSAKREEKSTLSSLADDDDDFELPDRKVTSMAKGPLQKPLSSASSNFSYSSHSSYSSYLSSDSTRKGMRNVGGNSSTRLFLPILSSPSSTPSPSSRLSPPPFPSPSSSKRARPTSPTDPFVFSQDSSSSPFGN
jgi:hypothetical protein